MKKVLLSTLGALLVSTGAWAQCPPGQKEVTVSIVTDRYGDETTWSLTGPGGSPQYANGGPYTLAAANGAYPQTPITVCIPDGAELLFTINDSYGDGMCCAYGAGGWTITVDGTDVSTGGTFTTVQTATVVLGTDLAVNTIGLDDVIAQGNTTITGTVRNNGITPVTGFTLAYTVGGSPQSQNFTNTVAPGASFTFNHSTPWNATVGSHNVQVTLSGVNGDVVAANNTLSKPIQVATQSVVRKTVVEEFTSSTCPPCASFNAQFDPLLTSLDANLAWSNVVAVKYQMNWPSPGNDPSYNPDGNTRKSYYGVTGIPDWFTDGVDPSGSTAAQAISNAAAKNAFCNIQLSNSVSGNTLTVSATVTPYANFPGTYKLYLVAVESYTYTGGTTSQQQYKHAQRKVFPNGSGITLANMQAGVPQTFTESYSFTTGGVAPGNYNLWGWMDGLTVVGFVQNVSSKAILQGAVSDVVAGLAENELERGLAVYPNPTNGQLFVEYTMDAGAQVNVEVFNALGAVVARESASVGSGFQRNTFDLTGLNDGIYYVSITAGDMRATRKVTLSR